MNLDELRTTLKANHPDLSTAELDRLCRDHLTSEIQEIDARLEKVVQASRSAATESERDRREEEEQAELRLALNDLTNALDQLGSGKA